MNWRQYVALVSALSFLLSGCGQSASGPSEPAKPDDAKSPAPIGYKLPGTGVLGLSDLSNFAKQERDFIKPDEFSKGFDDSPLDGRSFALTLPVSQFAGSSLNPAEWNYDADKQELTLRVGIGEMSSYTPKLQIQYTSEERPKTKMTNAFGAEIQVTPLEVWTINLGRDDDKPLGVFRKFDDARGINTNYDSLGWTMKLPPDRAKQLISKLTLRLEGTVQRDADRQTVLCYENRTAATFQNPTEMTEHECIIEVQLSRVAYVTSDGKTLKEWRDASQKTKPPKVISSDDEDVPDGSDEGQGIGPVVDENGIPLSTSNSSNDAGD